MTTRWGAVLAASLILVTWGESKAQTTNVIDMTTLTPAYLSNNTGFVNGETGPGFSQSATTNQLIITGTNLPVQSNSFAILPGLITGDFTATVQSVLTNTAGTNFSSNTLLGFAELGTFSSGGVVSTNFNFGASGGQTTINGPSGPSQQVTEQLSRMGNTLTGSVTLNGQQTQIFNLVGPSVVGPDGLSVSAFGAPGSTFSGTFTNFNVTTFAAAAITGVDGGTASNPVALPARTISSVAGSVGPAPAFFSFFWQGGSFQAQVDVPFPNQLLAGQSVEFELCGGVNCSNVLQTAVANSADGWLSILSGDLAPGYYTMGVLSPVDPDFSIDFTTPVIGGAVPEPSTWAMMILGFCVLGFATSRPKVKPALLAA